MGVAINLSLVSRVLFHDRSGKVPYVDRNKSPNLSGKSKNITKVGL